MHTANGGRANLTARRLSLSFSPPHSNPSFELEPSVISFVSIAQGPHRNFVYDSHFLNFIFIENKTRLFRESMTSRRPFKDVICLRGWGRVCDAAAGAKQNENSLISFDPRPRECSPEVDAVYFVDR